MRFLFAAVLLLQLLPPLQASTLPAEVYGKLASKSLLSLSPSGERLAYRSVEQGRDLIIVIDLARKQMISAVDASETNPTSIAFINNDLLLLRAVNHQRIFGFRGDYDMSGAYIFNLKNNKVHQLLVPGDGIYTGQTALGNVIGISEDKKFAYMGAWRTQGEYSLFKVNLTKRRTPRVYKKGTYDTIDFFLNKDNEVIARERFDRKKNIHRVQALIDGDWKDVFKEETEYRTKGFIGVTPDGRHLIMQTNNPDTGHDSFYKMSLADGSFSAPLFVHDNKGIDSYISGLDRIIRGVRYTGFSPTYEFFDNKLTKRMAAIQKAIPNTSIYMTDFTTDFSQLLLLIEGNEFAGDYFMYKDGKVDYITTRRPDVMPEQINPVTMTQYSARDNLTIPTLLTLPVNKKAEKLPAIMYPHGGPEAYDRFGFDIFAQYFASQGYAVIQPQFRGSDGFGVDFIFAGRGEWGKKMQDDLTDGVTHFVKEGIIDPEKVCIVGASYGGYAALAGVAFTPDQYQCAVSVNGVADINMMLKRERKDHGRNAPVLSYWEDVISRGEFDKDHLKSISPINFAKDIKVPVLLIHAENDEIVHIEQSEDMYDEMQDEGKDVKFVELEDGGHPLRTAKSRMETMKAIDTFIKQHL